MPAKGRRPLVFGGVVAVALLIGGGFYVYRLLQPREGRVRGVITEVDAAQRTATLEFVHPRTGDTFELRGTVPAETPIHGPGGELAFDDVAVGSEVEARGLLYPDRRIVALEVTVLSPATQPVAASAGRNGS